MKAMTCSSVDAALLLATASLLLVLSHCAQKIPQCQENLWRITYAAGAQEGQANLVITVPSITEKLPSVSSILTCEDLQVNGTGKTILQLDKGHNITTYHVTIPEARDSEEFESQGEWHIHSCILQFTYHPKSTYKVQSAEEAECELQLQTVLGRILPKCNLKRAQTLLKEVETLKDVGQVMLHFHNSGNDVFTHDSKCDVGSIDHHTHTEAMEENMIPLAPPGANSPIIDIDFYPDCDNETVQQEYRDREMSECHMEIYQVCQGGYQLVKNLKLDFDEGSLKCDPPKPSYQVLLEYLELKFYIDSRPVVALLALLLFNGVLYTLLIPAVICKMVGGKCSSCSRRTAAAEEKQPLLDGQLSPPDSPEHPTPLPITTNTPS